MLIGGPGSLWSPLGASPGLSGSSLIPRQFNHYFPVVLILGSRSMESFQLVIDLEVLHRLYTEYDAIYVSKLHTKMYQNTCVDLKLGYADAKSDVIAFCVKTYPSNSFIKNRTNMHEMQNRMKIAFCVKAAAHRLAIASAMKNPQNSNDLRLQFQRQNQATVHTARERLRCDRCDLLRLL